MNSSWLMRLGAVAAAGAFVWGPGDAAWAASTINLDRGDVGTAAAQVSTQCTGAFATLAANRAGWHFTLPATSADDFLSVNITYDTPTGPVTAIVNSANPASPSTGRGWSGYLATTGDRTINAYLTTEGNWTLAAGTAQVDADGSRGTFDLADACANQPAAAAPAARASGAPGANAGGGAGGAWGGNNNGNWGGGGDGGWRNGHWKRPAGAAATGGGGSQDDNTGVMVGAGALAVAGLGGAGLLMARRRRTDAA